MKSYTNNNDLQDIVYKLNNQEVDQLSKSSSTFFQHFSSDHGNQGALIEAIQKMQQAVDIAKSKLDQEGELADEIAPVHFHDYAFCLRKLASIIIRDETNNSRFSEAEKALFTALIIYKTYPSLDPVLALEEQRTLHQMRKVAYELKKGELLEKVINQFLPLAENNTAINFLIDCYESRFHLAFANRKFDEAKEWVKKTIALSEANKLESLTASLHLIKTNLAILHGSDLTLEEKKTFFITNIETPFWKVYDEHKRDLADDIHSVKLGKRMMKDLVLLFTIRCEKSLLGIPGKIPIVYVLQQANEIFKSKDHPRFKELKSILNKKVSLIQKTGELPLDYQFFSDSPPVAIQIPSNEMQKLFPAERAARFLDGRTQTPRPSRPDDDLHNNSSKKK